MRVLIIGGTGFIGPHVVRSLAEMGHEVTVFHRGQTEASLPPEVTHLRHAANPPGDRRHFTEFVGEFRRFAPDLVLDMIPVTEQGALTLMHTFKGVTQRVIAISSVDVYRAYGRFHNTEPGLPDPVPLAEDAPLREGLYPYRGEAPRSPDAPNRWADDYDKILVERVVLSDPHLPGTILRLPTVYGPGDGMHRLFEYLKRMDDGRPAILMEEGLAHWRCCRGYVENVAAAILRAVVDDRAAGRVYNVAEPEALPEAGWVRQIGQAVGWKGQVAVLQKGCIPTHLIGDKNQEQHLVVDTLRIRVELGYHELVSREEALCRTVEWERAHPPDKIDPKAFDYAAEDAALTGHDPHGR